MFRFVLLLLIPALFAQDPHAGHDMSQHDMSAMDHSMGNEPNSSQTYLMSLATGTSQNPAAWQMPMLMRTFGSWQTMFMGQAFIVDTQQSGPRGGDKLYSVNWGMFSATHAAGAGAFEFQTMLSLDPATVANRSYPLLFQTGETAYGRSLIDAQHPHDFIMSLGVSYVRPLAERTMLQIYFAPVGDPALGPVAFPHRASAMELPQATLGHHWQDSTHVANEVITVGVTHDKVRLEASGFHGREPNENRWNIDYGAIDSWSTRLSVFPTKNWTAQVSVGRLHQPEALDPGDVTRTTASVHYTRGRWSSSLIWGHSKTHSFTGETVAAFGKKNFLTARVESVAKDELIPGNYRIGAYTGGYTRDVGTFNHVETGLGANLTAYAIPSAMTLAYGSHPVGVNVYVRFRLR